MVTLDYVPKNRLLTTMVDEVSTGLTALHNTQLMHRLKYIQALSDVFVIIHD